MAGSGREWQEKFSAADSRGQVLEGSSEVESCVGVRGFSRALKLPFPAIVRGVQGVAGNGREWQGMAGKIQPARREGPTLKSGVLALIDSAEIRPRFVVFFSLPSLSQLCSVRSGSSNNVRTCA